ncbi:L-idonate 5-dehydrogenase [Nitratireductor sp. L1-7-SE]|uniref:L-idonate 5-dehydrogenase n=1 Tax=Nitratireductor rhodophyticola TaxID=2854036 RepID=A0ABS7R7X0_9HYPH|nr:L-idonate 5-dehydrogenase [Nitratireductor rhodophyticola]MBY8917044.1 L-idonate 5-dehydrogenase [Nitratireductor rhodophyticola]MBY8920527.1 L-idonate 5-dehydrogenase [Nitratireductor rhodophyticola]
METRVCRLYDKHDLRVETETIAEPAHDQVLVAIGAGGICGSDLHYFHDGGFGPIRIREPIILGHEVAGTVLAVGPDVTGLDAGDRVAINPSRPCHACKYCLEGLFNHCLNMRFYGSAIRFPHEQGAFRDRIISEAFRCEKIRPSTSLAEAACAEPLAVCLHARSQAGTLKGKRVLITGAGPIGALCAAVAKEDGAAEIVITDLQEKPLAVARRMGATSTINVARDSAPMSAYTAEKGYFDVAFECSAAGPAIRMAIECVRPCGIIVQVGVTGDIALPINAIAAKEITLRGTHRFHAEYSTAVRLIDSGKIDVRPVITDTFPLERVQAAFETAGDRTRSVKVQLTFE